MLTSAAGIGYLVTLNRTILDSPRVFAAILTILVLSIAYYMLARALESRMVVWQSAGRQQSSAAARRPRRPPLPAPPALVSHAKEHRHHASAPAADHRRRQLPAARLAGEPRDAVEGRAAHAHEDIWRMPGALARAGAGRRHHRSPSATWSGPASTSSPTARSGARATPTASPPRSRASTRTSPAQVQGALGPRDAGAARRRQDPPHARRSSCATWSSCAPTPTAPAKITLPGPFTMSQQAKNEFYKDDEEMVMDFAVAVNEEAHDLEKAGADVIQLDEPWLRNDPEAAKRYAVKAINRALRGHHGADRRAPVLRLRGAWCRARPSRAATRSCRSSPTRIGRSRSRSRRRSRSSTSAC